MKVRLVGIMTSRELATITRFFIDFDTKFSIDVKDINVINYNCTDVTVEINFTCNQDVISFSVLPRDTDTEVNVKLERYGIGFLFKELTISEIK